MTEALEKNNLKVFLNMVSRGGLKTLSSLRGGYADKKHHEHLRQVLTPRPVFDSFWDGKKAKVRYLGR